MLHIKTSLHSTFFWEHVYFKSEHIFTKLIRTYVLTQIVEMFKFSNVLLTTPKVKHKMGSELLLVVKTNWFNTIPSFGPNIEHN